MLLTIGMITVQTKTAQSMKINHRRPGVSRPERPVKPQSCFPVKPAVVFQHCMLLLFLISSFSVTAQSFRVSGKVTDDIGKGLSGVTIGVKGNPSRAVVSDSAGAFPLYWLPAKKP